eukprot:358796-Chlamydomonas_euryale.AAC.13
MHRNARVQHHTAKTPPRPEPPKPSTETCKPVAPSGRRGILGLSMCVLFAAFGCKDDLAAATVRGMRVQTR